MCCVLFSWFVEINTWQVLKCTYLVLIQCSWLVEIYTWHGYFGWACINEACQFQLQGHPILITKLYSLKYKASLVWCMWVVHEFETLKRCFGCFEWHNWIIQDGLGFWHCQFGLLVSEFISWKIYMSWNPFITHNVIIFW